MNVKWARVAGAVREQIGNGMLKPGARPSVTRLSAELGVGRRTAAKALADLEAEGLVERQPGIGYVVMARPGRGAR